MNPNQPPRDIDDSAFAPPQPPMRPIAPAPPPSTPAASPFSTMPNAGSSTPTPVATPQPTPSQQPVSAPVPPMVADVVMQPTPPAPSAPLRTNFSPPPSQPQQLQHLPDEIANKIGETPQQTSKEIQSKANYSHRLKLKSIISVAAFIACVGLAAVSINQFVFQSYFVDGTSMTPTLQNSDRLIISKVERTGSHLQGKPYIPERGQIVVLDSSIVGLNGQNEQLIKRVIGLPGDTVHIENGVVTIKNSQFPDGFNADQQLSLNVAATYSDSSLDFIVGDHQVFVMGDNRGQNGSYDSRAFGPVDAKNIEGRLWARILPINEAKIFSMLYLAPW